MTLELSEQTLHNRTTTLLALLDRVGEAELTDTGPDEDERVVTAAVSAPLEPPFRVARFEYVEVYERRARSRWRVAGYTYEFQQQPGPGRRAFHRHDPWGHHFHCLDPRQPDRDDHFRGYEVDVFEAHQEFLRLYASGEIECSGLHPLHS